MSNCSLMEFYCRNLFDLINLNSRRIMITNKKETMGKFDLIISEIIDIIDINSKRGNKDIMEWLNDVGEIQPVIIDLALSFQL